MIFLTLITFWAIGLFWVQFWPNRTLWNTEVFGFSFTCPSVMYQSAPLPGGGGGGGVLETMWSNVRVKRKRLEFTRN